MASMVDAQTGLWWDYSRGNLDRGQVLVTGFWSQWMTALVAVSLTIISPCIFKIVKNYLIYTLAHLAWVEAEWARIRGQASSQSQATAAAQSQPLLRLQQSESSRGFISRTIERLERPGAKTVFITAVLVSVFVALAIANTYSGKIASDRTGLSSSENCGIWQFDENAGPEVADREDRNNYRKEARASQYARNCYASPDAPSTLSCKIFYNQSIAYTTSTQQRCPFASQNLCLGGLYSAVTFDTGLIDGSAIGVNSPSTHRFRRTTTCSPLNMSKSYVQAVYDNENDTAYRYHYGSKDYTDYTFNTSGSPFEWLIPAYSVNTYFSSSLFPDQDYWHPIPELQGPQNSTTTIMFISSMHIYYTTRSDDPIFPATTPHYFPGLSDPYYYNADPRARPLACVDTTIICSPTGQTCWSMTAPVPPAVHADPAYWLLKWSLENSDTYDAIKWRLGTALLAQESISQSVSSALSPVQWQLETEHLFATSLATIQYDAWGIATGEDRERPGYVETTPDEGRGQLCGRYKFKTADYTNVNLAAFVGVEVLALVIFVLSWDWGTVRVVMAVWCCGGRGRREGGGPLVIDVVVGGVCRGLCVGVKGLYRGGRFLVAAAWRWGRKTLQI